MLAELQTQKEFVNNLSDKGKKIIQENPQKKRETMEKLRAVGDKWKRVHRLAAEKQEYLTKCISEVETFEMKYNECMEALEKFSGETVELIDTSKDFLQVELTVDEVLQVGHRISSLLPENERAILEERLEKLRFTWKEMRDVREESARVHATREVVMVEEADALESFNETFAHEMEAFNAWLSEAETTLKIDMFTVPEEEQMNVIRKQEKLYNEIQQQSLVVSDIMNKGKEMSARVNEEERAAVQNQLEELSVRWSNVRTLSELQNDELERCIGEQSDYYELLEKCVMWMQEASVTMAADGADPLDAAGVRVELQTHLELCKEITHREHMVSAVMDKGTTLCDKLAPEEKTAVIEQLARVKDDWSKLQQQAKEKENELRRCLGEPVEDELESKKVLFAGVLMAMKSWIIEAREKVMGMTTASTTQELQESVNACACVRSALVDQQARFEDVMVKGKVLIAELKNENSVDMESINAQLEELKAEWGSLKENLNKLEHLPEDEVEKLEKGDATRRDFESDLGAAKEWIEKAKCEIAQVEHTTGDIPALEEQAERLKNIVSDCQYQSNVVNALLMESETALQDADETKKQIFELQLVELKTSIEEVSKQSRVEVEKLEESILVNRDYQDSCQKLKTWIENEYSSFELLSTNGDVSSLEKSLEELTVKQQNISVKEKELKELREKALRITNLDVAGEKHIESQLLSLQMSYSELKSKVFDKLESTQGESKKVKEFKAELQHCREIVQEIENVVSSDPPSFPDVESMESYVQELKGKFQEALAQRSAIFQLGEKKDQALSVANAEKNYTDVVDQWKSLLACFSRKIAETERRIAEETELNESFEEVSSRMDTVEKELEISFDSERAREVGNVVGQVEKLKTLSTECASYEQFVESLRGRVEGSPSKPSDGNENRLSSLEARVGATHKLLKEKLEDVEQCANDVTEVTEMMSSCKEWLLKEKELIVANEQGVEIGNVKKLEGKLLELQQLNQETATVLHEITQAKDKVGKGVGKVSSALEESLSKELKRLCDAVVDLREETAAKSVELERCLSEAKEFEQEMTRYETLLQEADGVLRGSSDKPPSVGALKTKLGELRGLQEDLSEKQEEFHCFQETKKAYVAQSGVQERLARGEEGFENVMKQISPAMNKIEKKINEYVQCGKEVNEALEWLDQSAVSIHSNVGYSLAETTAEEELAKIKDLRTELDSFGFKLSAMEENGKVMGLIRGDAEDDLQEKINTWRAKWEALCNDAKLKEALLVAFAQAKETYSTCAGKCKNALEDLKKFPAENDGFSAVPEKCSAQLERQRDQQRKCEELEKQIHAMETAGNHLGDTCEELRELLREDLKKVKDDWQKISMETVIMQEQLAAWISEVERIREDMEVSLSRVKTIHESLQSCKQDANNIRTANDDLGQAKQLSSELQAEKENVDSIIDKAKAVLVKLGESEKADLQGSLRALKTALHQAEEESSERVKRAEELINDIIELDKESARCESLLTIYQAAAPVDVTCTVETLEDQMAKLKRLYNDMESRDSQMTSLREIEAKLSRDSYQSVGASAEGKAGKLQGDWGKLKASVGEKLREFERLVEMKKDFEDEYEMCLGGVRELESAIRDAGSDERPVEARIQEMQELCARIKSYRNKLDLLTDRCDELPNVAYEQKDLDPRKKLSTLVKRWKDVKDDALGKLNELERDKMEMQHVEKEISKFQRWVQDVCTPFVDKDLPSVVQRSGLEKALLDNTEFSSIMRTKYEWLNELLVKIRNLDGLGQNKESILDDLRDVTGNLEDAKAKLANNDAEIKVRLQQHATLTLDVDHVRALLLEVKGIQSSETIELESDNWLEERIASQRVASSKIESCELLLASVATKIGKASPGESESEKTAIESDCRTLSEDIHAVKHDLTKEILRLEKLRDFVIECAEISTLYEALGAKIRAVDLHSIAQTANITRTEEELAKCRAVHQQFSKRDGDFEACAGKEEETLRFTPNDKKHEIEEDYRRLKEERITLKELIQGRIEALRKLVAEQQTLEGWLKQARNLIQEAATCLRENEATLEDSRMSDRFQALSALTTKLEEYHTYSEMFQGSGKASEVEEVKAEMTELKEQLVIAHYKLQQFKEHREAFQTEVVEAEKIFQQCAADQFSPASLQEAQEKLVNVKVNYVRIILAIHYSSSE